jgi:D-alanine-D-alanine ligase
LTSSVALIVLKRLSLPVELRWITAIYYAMVAALVLSAFARGNPGAMHQSALWVGVPLIWGSWAGAPATSLPGEIEVVGDHEFYDFEAKYLDEAGIRLTAPADLPEAVTARVRELSARAFEAMGCEGLARVDFFVLDDGSVIVNEINTMPGFTPLSMYPKVWAATGLAYPDLVDRLLQLALSRPTGLR